MKLKTPKPLFSRPTCDIIPNGSLAQSVEQRAFNPLVQGSSP